jgi:hypothetical protein
MPFWNQEIFVEREEFDNWHSPYDSVTWIIVNVYFVNRAVNKWPMYKDKKY